MLTWSKVYNDDLSFYVEASDDNSTYFFSYHSIDRMFERNKNISSIADLERPIRRIIKCINYWRTDNWIMKYAFGTRLIIHDVDIKMMYIIKCNVTHYDIISIFNEYKQEYDNTQNTPELYISLKK